MTDQHTADKRDEQAKAQAFDSRPRRVILIWLALCVGQLALSARDLTVPGLNYDEAVHAGFARDFVEGTPRGTHYPDAETICVFGRPLAWKNQFYEGGVKSQFLIPTFALFSPSPQALRLTTIAWGLLALLFAMLWADRVLGWSIAVLGGLLMAFDPSLLFAARQDWGSVGPGLWLRCAAFYLTVVWWHSNRTLPAIAAGFLFGLLVYHRVDSGVFLAAAAMAIIICQPRSIAAVLRTRIVQLAFAAVAMLIAAAPMISSVLHTMDAAAEWSIRPEMKVPALWTTFDGSYIYRLMAVGGQFDQIFDIPDAPKGLFAWGISVNFAVAFLVAVAVCVFRLLRPQDSRPIRAPIGFCLLATVLGLVCVLLIPAAERIQHVLNVAPFPHFVVASAAWILIGRVRFAWLRTIVALCLVAMITIASLTICMKTLRLIEDTGGRGWWSNALNAYIKELDEAPQRVAVCLDWGFNEQILFLGKGAAPYEPIWELERADLHDGSWEFNGRPEHLYLIHEQPYDLFGYGTQFLALIRQLDASLVQIRHHNDRQGRGVFLSIRLMKPHRLIFRDGRFNINWG